MTRWYPNARIQSEKVRGTPGGWAYFCALPEDVRLDIDAAIPDGHHLSISYPDRPESWTVRAYEDGNGLPLVELYHQRDLAAGCRAAVAALMERVTV